MLLFLVVLSIAFLSSPAYATIEQGEGLLDVEGGRIWYRIVGSGEAVPLLLLHGGPGSSCDYLMPLAALSDERPVVFYDQLGSGRSDRPTEPELWQMDRFVSELAQVREKLGLEDVYILGHSWGTMLAVDYMLTKPKGVHGLVLASPVLSVERWADDTRRLLAALPDSIQQTIKHHEAEGTLDSVEYQMAMGVYYSRHLCRSNPWPAEMESTLTKWNPVPYEHMWGPLWWEATGSLKDYERADRLPDLDLPVLFTAGVYDDATPETTEYFQCLVPDSKLAIFENSGHMTMLDDREEYIGAVRSFLRETDEKR